MDLAPFWLPPMPDRPDASAVFYDPETAKPVQVYGDPSGECLLASPIAVDYQGWFPAMWLKPGSYRLAINDAHSEWMVQKAIVVVGLSVSKEPLPLPKKDFVEALADLLEAYQEVPQKVIMDALEVALEVYQEG